jgi:hypothetical protein
MIIKVEIIGQHKKNVWKKKNGTKVKDNQKLLMNVYLTKAVNENDAYDRF